MKTKIRTLLAGVAIATTAINAAQALDIEWWDFLAGGDGVRMRSMIDQFNSEHPDIQIKPTTLEWGDPYYTKVRTSVAVGEGPDIMTYHLSRYPLGIQDGSLSPITEEDMANSGVTTDQFNPASIAAATADDGTLYGVPFDIHAIVLYYNKTKLEGSPYLDADGKLTGLDGLDNFNAAMKWAQDNGSATPVSYQSEGGGGTYRIFYSLLKQQGGELIVDGEVLPGDNLDKATKAIQTMTDWRSAGYTPEQAAYEASVALYTSGDSVFQINGVWEVPTYADLAEQEKLGFEWGAVEIPTWMETPATWADSHSFAVPNQDMDPETRKAVMEIIGWMNEHSITWASAGHIPAFKPTVESPAYQAMEPNATYASLAEHAVFDPRSPIAGVASPVYSAMNNYVAPAVHGFMTPEEAATQMRDELQSLIQ